MKVLLVGEYSGFFTNLKKGLEELGVQCTLASNGDGWKKISGSDIELYHKVDAGVLKRAIYHDVIPMLTANKFYGYDVVQYVATEAFTPHITIPMFNRIKAHSKRIFISVAGGCHSLYESYERGDLGYYTFDDNPETVAKYNLKSKSSQRRKRHEEYIYSHVDGIIPIMYEYAVGVRERNNCKETIPLPFDASCVEYKPNIANDKIVIAHGLLREKSKGTVYIKKALEIIKERHPNEVEIVIDGKMPLNQYLEWLSKANILVDQCKEHCYGLNALYAMAQGRIVLGGASDNSLKEFGVEECPVIHIEPNVEMIVEKLEMVISQRKYFEQMGYSSRKYVENVHNHVKVAQKYIEVWSK